MYRRKKYSSVYLDKAAKSFSEAYYDKSSDQKIKNILQKLYKKYNKAKDFENIQLAEQIHYSVWEKIKEEYLISEPYKKAPFFIFNASGIIQ